MKGHTMDDSLNDVQRLEYLAKIEQKHNAERYASNEGTALTGMPYRKGGSIFIEGHRIRMNAVALLLNICIPWSFFVTCYMITGFYLMYKYPKVAYGVLACIILFWIYCVRTAIEARWKNPDPTWFTYFAIALFLCILSGTLLGFKSMSTYMNMYYDIGNMQVAGLPAGSFGLSGGPLSGGFGSGGGNSGVNMATVSAATMMDAGIVKFAPGTEIAREITGHFHYKTTYCVAPLTGPNGIVSKLQYDVWVVGKGCCLIHASDFRCGAWNKNVSQVLATRITNDNDLKYFYLGAQQTASIHGLKVVRPLFFYLGNHFLNMNSGSTTSDGSGSATGNFMGGSGNSASSASVSGSYSGSYASGTSGSYTGGGGGIHGGITQSPMAGVKKVAYNTFLFWCGVALICCIFGVCMAAAKYSFLGRSRWYQNLGAAGNGGRDHAQSYS